MRILPAVEGRFQRWGNWAEYDQWLADVGAAGAAARPLGGDPDDAVGEPFTLPVVVHNWSTASQSGTVSLTLPTG